MSDLRALAARYCSLSDELDAVRSEMVAALGNGHAPEKPPPGAKPNFTKPRVRAEGAQPKVHPNAARASEIEASILEVIRQQPGIRVTQIAKATASKSSSTVQRLARLAGNNRVQRDAEGGYVLPI